jgi:catecholate siderophore receptor
MQSAKPTSSLLLSTSASELPPSTLSPFAWKTLAFVPSLIVAGSIGTQAAEAPASPASTAAGPDTVELPAVVVEGSASPKMSSPKFTAPLVDTPQTVVVISREIFEQQGAANLSDVLRNTPGITFYSRRRRQRRLR